MRNIVIMPGGFHPFHAGHAALYKSAVTAFNDADTYVAATNDTKTRPFPFAIKEKLAKLAGVADKHFIQVKSPFQPREITDHYNPEEDVLIFVRSEKDRNESPKPGGTKKDGTPAYFQPWTGKNVQPFGKQAYIAYLPTVEFGPGITSATEIRNAWPKLNDKRKTAMVMSLYPVTQKNPKLAANVVKMLDMGMGGQENMAEGKLIESAVFLNPTTVIVGQAHGQPLELSPNTLKQIQAIAAKHGAYYEGNGTDRAYTKGQIDRYVGSWDDEVAKTANPNDPKWLYVLFANVDANNRVQRVGVDPKDTIFNRLLATAKDNSFQGIGYTSQALQKFLQMSSEGKYDFVKMSQQPATQENLTRFLKAGEALMWPSNWEQYPNKAGKIAKAATVDVRDQYLATRKAGVYVTGSGHLKAVQNITGKQGVAEGSDQITEYRNRLLQYVKSLLPTWPEYVLKDWLVPNKGDFSNLPPDALKNSVMEKVKGAGLTPNSKWQLVPDMKFTMDMFDPMTKQRLIGRAGGSSDLGMGIPRDKERHATQAALAQQQGGVRKEPVLLIKTNKGYELLEGWHRTIQHFHKFPDGYTGPAYVAVAQGQQGVAEGYSNTTFNVDRRKLNVPALIQKGAILVTHPHGEQGWETDNKEDWAFSLLSLYNVLQGGWASEAKKYLKPESYKRAEQQINSSAPNLGSDKLVYDGKYNQILWSIKKLGIPDNVAFLDKDKQGVAEGSLNEFVPPSSGDGSGGDDRSRRIRKLLEIAIQVAKEKNVDELGMIHAMNMIAGDEFFNTAVEGILPDITDKEYMFVLQSAYKTVKQGLAETINSAILNKKFKHKQVIGDYTYTATAEDFEGSPLLWIKAYDGKKEIGHILFEIIVRSPGGRRKPSADYLESGGTEVDPAYRDKGVASTMYAYAKMLGNDIQASYNQTSQGKAMWKAWEKAGDAKHLVGTSMESTVSENLNEGPFVQRLGRPNKVNIYIRSGNNKPPLLVATDIPYQIFDKYVAKVIQKYPQFKQTDFSFKSLDKIDEFVTPDSGDDREPDEEILRQLAAQWWNGTSQQMAKAQRTLELMGWEIGQDESGDDDAGVFVIRAGDENGDSYIAFPHSALSLDDINEDYLDEN